MELIEFQLDEEEVEELIEISRETLDKIGKIIKRHVEEFRINEEEKIKVFRLFIYMLTTRYTSMLLEMLNTVDHEFAKAIAKRINKK